MSKKPNTRNLAKKWAVFVMHPAVRTAVYGILLGLLGAIAFFDGMNAMDAIARQCSTDYQAGINISQALNQTFKYGG